MAPLNTKVANTLTAAVTREMIERSHYRVVANPDDADAILKGGIVTFTSYPVHVRSQYRARKWHCRDCASQGGPHRARQWKGYL